MAKRGSNIYKRRDGRFEGRVPVGYRDNGKIKYKSVYARTLSEVKEKMAEVYSIKQNHSVSAMKLTVQTAAQQWLSSAKLRVKESSYANYENIISKHILPFLGGEFMSNLTTSKLNDFIHYKLNNGRLNGNGGLSAKSVRDIMTVYRSIEAYAAREYGIRETHFTMPKTEKKQIDVLNAFERKRLENYLLHNQNNTNISVLLCLFTGLRVGELCGLNWGDIDFINGVIRVNKTLQYLQSEVDKKCRYVIQTPKTSSSIRTIPMVSQLVEILKKHWEEQHTQIIYLGDAWQKNGEKLLRNLVFTTRFGNPMDRNSVNRSISSIIRDLNKEGEEKAKKENSQYVPIKDFSPHCMRHSFATRCFEAGIEPKIIQMYMGHSTLAVTMDIYTHVSENGKKEEIKKIEKAV